MRKKLAAILCVLLSIASLSGCANVPDIEESDGIQYAQGKVQGNIEEILNADGTETVQREGEEYQYTNTIEAAGSTFQIDATVKNVDLSGVKILTVDPCEDLFDEETVRKVFFDGVENVKNITEQVNAEAETIEQPEELITVHMCTTSRLCLETEDGEISFSRSNDSSFYYSNDILNGKNKQIFQGEFTETAYGEIPDYSWDEAKKLLTSMMAELGLTEIQIVSQYACSDGSTGSYDVKFTPMVHGLPIAFNPYAQDIDNVIDVMATVSIMKEGIFDLQANNCLWEVIGEEDCSCISLDQAVAVAEQYIQSGDLVCSDEVIYTRCELTYFPTTEDWVTATFMPVWRFYVSLEEQDDLHMQELRSEGVSLDFCISAVDGKLLSIY